MTQVEKTYRAIRLTRIAPSFREACDIVELPSREPGPGEIRVRNRFCGIRQCLAKWLWSKWAS